MLFGCIWAERCFTRLELLFSPTPGAWRQAWRRRRADGDENSEEITLCVPCTANTSNSFRRESRETEGRAACASGGRRGIRGVTCERSGASDRAMPALPHLIGRVGRRLAATLPARLLGCLPLLVRLACLQGRRVGMLGVCRWAGAVAAATAARQAAGLRAQRAESS